jgi:hypothetical protein
MAWENNSQENAVNYGEPIKIYDFSKGLWTVRPEMLIPQDGATPYCKNVWYDEKYNLSKMPGTELLLAEANNVFSNGECYRLWKYVTEHGEEQLIYQGYDTVGTTMQLWKLAKQSSYPASVDPTDITPTSGLTAGKRCYFTNYKSKMFLTNGYVNLKYYDGSDWTELHDGQAEKFKYSTVYDDCLVLGYSKQNPSRIAYTDQNEFSLYKYYNLQTHWRDLPLARGDYIMWVMVSPRGSLVVFGRHSIHEIYGSIYNDADYRKLISPTRGTIDGCSVEVLGDSVIFASDDGLYALAGSGINVSPEDQKLQVERSVIPLTAEIRNWWVDNIKTDLPDPGTNKELVWSGYESFTQTIAFDTGSTEILPDMELSIGGTTKRCKVVAVDVDTGVWGSSTAAGTLYVTNLTPYDTTFSNNDIIYYGSTQYALVNGAYEPGSVDTGHTRTSETVYMECNRPPVTTNPDVVNFTWRYDKGSAHATMDDSNKQCLMSTNGEGDSETTNDGWVDMISAGRAEYWSQRFGLTGSNFGNGGSFPGVFLYFKETGDASDIDGNVVITAAVRSKGEQTDEPYFERIVAEGDFDGTNYHAIEALAFDAGELEPLVGWTVYKEGDHNVYGTVAKVVVTSGLWSSDDAAGYIYLTDVAGTWAENDKIEKSDGTDIADVDVGDTLPISSGCWIYVPLTYWKHPLPISETGETHFLVVRFTTSGDADNYWSWGYDEDAGGTPTYYNMVNSNGENPSSQEAKAYNFMLKSGRYTPLMFTEPYIILPPMQADADWEHWESVTIETVDPTYGGYDTQHSIIDKVYYEVKETNASWGSWTETSNGGGISGTGRWIRLKIMCDREGFHYWQYMDSIIIKKVTVSYGTKSVEGSLTDAVVFENRYWYTTVITDPEEVAS